MTTSSQRDNAYWAARMEKDGFDTLLSRVKSGELSMYRARQEAGYLKKAPATVEGKLSYHWKRAGAAERKRFVAAHAHEINHALLTLAREAKERNAKKPSE